MMVRRPSKVTFYSELEVLRKSVMSSRVTLFTEEPCCSDRLAIWLIQVEHDEYLNRKNECSYDCLPYRRYRGSNRESALYIVKYASCDAEHD